MSDAGVMSSSSSGRVLSALVAGGDTAKVEEASEELESGSVQLVHIGDALVSEVFSAIADTDDSVCFWAGDDFDTAAYFWSFSGSDIDSASVTDCDLTVEDVTGSYDKLDDVLDGRDYITLNFAQVGSYPYPATFAYRVADVYPEGERLTLYYYDEEADSLVKAEGGLEVVEGYVTFKMSRGGIWVLSADDSLAGSLADLKGVDSEDGDVADADSGDSAAAVEDTSVDSRVIAAVAAVLAAVVAASLVVLRKRKSNSAPVQEIASEGSSSSDVTNDGNTAEDGPDSNQMEGNEAK